MADPWLAIIGLGEDGPAGLSGSSRAALAEAEVVFGGPRHLALAGAGARGVEWPVPFDIAPVLAARGRRAVVLASGDPFWHGAGSLLAARLAPGEWVGHPAPSCFQLAANRLGWRLEEAFCLGLHAAPFARLRPVLGRGVRVLATLRDGAAAPVMAAIEGRASGLSRASGLPDDLFAHDGQITKRPVRALTLSALAPRPGERLWDLGAGSGSVSVEWCLAGGRAVAVERRAARAASIRANAGAFGLAHRLAVVEGEIADALAGLPPPDAVFLGGGADAALIATLWQGLPSGARVVANAVTLEGEAMLAAAHAAHGGSLMRIELAQAGRLGGFRDWQPSRPVVQWSAGR